MASNIEIANELNKLLEEQLKIVEEQNKALKEQGKLSQAVLDTFTKVKSSKPGDSVNELNKTMKEAASTSGDFSRSFNQGLSEIAKKTYSADKAARSFASTWTKLAKTPAKVLVIEQAIQGFASGIQFSNGLLGTMVKTVHTLTGAMFNLGVSIVTAPFKMLNVLMEEAAGTSGVALAQQIEEVRKQFGDLAKNEAGAVMKSFRSLKGELSNTGLSVHRVLGNMAERLQFVRETAVAMGRSLNKFTKEFATNGEAIAAYTKGLGLAAEQIKAVADFSNAAGKDMTEVSREITTMAYGVGESFHINGKLVSRDISEMMKDFKNFGSLSTKQLTQISVFTHKLGLEVKDLLGIIDKFDNFEDAANSAAQLSQAFGLQLDTLDLMFDQDPASRFEKLRKSFLATGKTVESLSRQEKALLASQTGLSEAALQVGFAQANMGMSYEEIQKQSSLTEKKQLSQAEAMDKLANSIERMVKEGEQMKGGFFDIFLQGFFRGIQIGGKWHKLMFEIKRAMREIWRAGREVGIAFEQMWPGVKDIFDGLHDLFQPKKWKSLRTGLVDVFKSIFGDMAGGGKFSIKTLIEKLQKLFKGFYDLSSPGAQKILGGFKKFFESMADIGKELVKMLMENLTYALNQLGEFLKDPQKYLSNAKTAGSGITKWVIQLLEPIWKTIVEQWPALKAALMQLGKIALDKFLAFAKEHWTDGVLGVFLYMTPSLIAGVSKAFGSALAAAAVKGISQYALPKVGSILGKFFNGFGDAAQAASSAPSGMGKAMEAVTKSVEGVAQGAEATKKMTASDIAKFGAKLVMVAAAVSVGVVALVLALVAVAKILKQNGLDSVEKITPPLLVLGAAIVGVTAIGFLARTMGSVPWAAVAKSMAVGALGVAALGGISIALAWFFKKATQQLEGITATDATKTIAVLGGMMLSLAGLALLLIGAGAIILNPVLGALALAGVVGLGLLATISYAVLATAKGMIKEINNMSLGPNFGEKLNAFKTVVTSLTDFARVFVDLLSEAKPSFFSLKGMFGDSGQEVEKALKPLHGIVKGLTQSIKTIFETVKQSLSTMSGTVNMETVNSFIKMFSVVVELATSLQSQGMNKIIDKISDDSASPVAIQKLSEKLSSHVWAVSGAIKQLVPLMQETFSQIGNLALGKDSFKKIEAFTQFMTGFTQLATALQGEQLKISSPGEEMINFLSGVQNNMLTIAQQASELKDTYISQAAESIKGMLDMINGIQQDLTKISKSGEIKPLNVQLKQTADKLGLAGTNEIKLKMDEINFHIHVDVKISTDELEKSLLEKPNARIVGKR